MTFRRWILLVVGVFVGAVLGAYLYTSARPRDPSNAYRMGPGVGGPKRPGGAVPPGLRDPKPERVIEPVDDEEYAESQDRFRIFLESGVLPRLRHLDDPPPMDAR